MRAPRPLGPFLDVAEATGGELERLVIAEARPHEVAAALLVELRRRGATVLVLEDLHWADEATLDVLALLAARIASAPAGLASYRDDELDRTHQLRLVLGELVRRPGRMKLDALSRAAVAELAGPAGVDPEELYRRTGGNPFLVTEVLAAGGEQVPESVRDAVLTRSARLSAPARGLLDAVAVIPGQLELWLLEALAGELIDRLDECLASGILAAESARIAFRRRACTNWQSKKRSRPSEAFGCIGARCVALAARGGTDTDVAALAHHADAAGDGDGVLRWAPLAAGRAAASGSRREAAVQYARALRFAGGLSPLERAELLERRAEECYLTAQIDAAVAAQREALECHRQLGDVLREGDALRVLSRTLFFVGRTAEGEAAGGRPSTCSSGCRPVMSWRSRIAMSLDADGG